MMINLLKAVSRVSFSGSLPILMEIVLFDMVAWIIPSDVVKYFDGDVVL